MATSMGPNFAGHPAMGHPGVAGHPMGAPGMPPNAGQQGAPGGMPHQFAGGHIAVSGPGGQVNPAMMGGMPPGASPGPHAVHQLTPAQQQMFQQQQQHLQQQFNMNNPSAMAAIRQQQLLQQQQQRQAMFAQQFQGMNTAGVNGLPMGMQLSPQQLQHLRQRSAAMGHVGAHNPQAIMAQQLALQQHAAQQQAAQQAQQQAAAAQQAAQQQAAHNQQMAAGHNQAQHMAMNAQPMGMQQQNPMAAAAQTQMGAQQQQNQQPPGQPQPPQQQQPGPQSQQAPQQTSQAGTPAPSGQQTPSQTPAPTPAHANQMPPGQSQPQQAQPPNQAQMAAQQLMASSMMQQQQMREGMKTRCLLKLMQFGERLSGYPGAKNKDDLSYWNRFVAQFFSPNGVFRHSLHVSDSEDTPDKQYDISYPAIARYFHTHFSSGVKSMQLILDSGSSDKHLPGDCYCIENPRASFVYWFETGSHLVATGTLRAQFDAEQKIELFEFLTTRQEEYVSRKRVIEAAKPAHEWIKEWRSVNTMDGKQSPEMSKKGKARQLKSPQKEPPGVLVDLPDSAVNSKGVTEAVHQFLEIVEVMGQMNPLFGFYHSNPGLSPYGALEQYVATQINNNAAPMMNGQTMVQGPRTPSFGQFPMGASPAAVHMNLPGSPHIGSPAPGQAPGMQLQPSQQGTSSSGPSANTSPASNKRRRPSTVKVEDDAAAAGAAQVNGIQNRGKPQTPRMAKRLKGNPS
ncbi:Adhesion defective protein 1 [Trichoderma ghanense]|uniref:Adhesion defective protein 1 n=1 Tax=Trichoderma ghanense TaxID=65468 RepID=A0ABY2GP27_9HYPO